MLAEASCAEGCCGALTSPSSAKATRSPGGTGGPRATPRAASSISSSGQLGVGPEVASALLVAARDNPGRLRTEASFAALCGTSPVEASSGKITRHRLNQGGKRRTVHQGRSPLAPIRRSVSYLRVAWHGARSADPTRQPIPTAWRPGPTARAGRARGRCLCRKAATCHRPGWPAPTATPAPGLPGCARPALPGVRPLNTAPAGR
jgi:hypothetical protein